MIALRKVKLWSSRPACLDELPGVCVQSAHVTQGNRPAGLPGEGHDSMTQELETASGLTPAEYYWQEVTQGADRPDGADLEKGANLIGVPMCITKAVFRQGDFLNQGITGWYVSLEALIAPASEIARAYRRGRIPEGVSLTVEPGEEVVFNEGGTGVYRQIVNYLEAKGLVKINSDLPETGKWGESRYDILPPEWEVSDEAKLSLDPESGKPNVSFDIRLLCPRGLRTSKYENEYTKQGETRYLG